VILSTLIHRSSNPSGLLIFCAIGFCAGIGLFIYGFRLLQRRRLILDTPFSNIRSASMGMVEISGQAVGPYTMIAPITGRPCYYFRTLVWEYKQQGKNKQWVKIVSDCMHLPFFIDDNTARVLVDPRGADLELHCDFEQQFSDSFFTTKDPVPDNVRGFLSRHGIVTYNKIKVEEYCIKPKNSMFILGTLGDNPGLEVNPQPVRETESINSISNHGFAFSLNSLSFPVGSGDADFHIGSMAQRLAMQPDASPEVIRLSPASASEKSSDRTQQQKIAAALMKAGISNPAAWAAAGVPSAGDLQVVADPATATTGNGTGDDSSAAQTNAFDPRPPVVLMKGTNHKTFLISWRSQQEVARSLGWKCMLMIWGGPALALLSLYFFLGIKSLF
jgi:hypothetical protein